MNKILSMLLVAGVAVGSLSCSGDLDYEPGGTNPVRGLLLPEDNCYVELQSASSASQPFSWEPALAVDGQPPHYEVVFLEQPDGEIVYRYDAGSKTSVAVPHKELNLAAKAAGIETGSSGDFYWSVVSSRGVTVAPVGVRPRCISVKRLFGFDVIPSTLYLTGEATEVGEDLSRAMQFQSTGEDIGEFTAIMRLEAGKTFSMYETTDASSRHFSIEEGELREFGADVKPATSLASVDKTGIYRIRVDFNTRSTLVEEVARLAFYQRDEVDRAVDMIYRGVGVWALENHETSGGDNRYGFLANIRGARNYQEKWSSINFNNNNAPTTGTSLEWWKIYMNKDTASDGWWGYAFKWIDSEWAEKKVVTIEMHMDHSQNFFYHKVTYVK